MQPAEGGAASTFLVALSLFAFERAASPIQEANPPVGSGVMAGGRRLAGGPARAPAAQ